LAVPAFCDVANLSFDAAEWILPAMSRRPLFHSIFGVGCLHCSHQVMDAARFAAEIARRASRKEASEQR
jgi:hypothetical protein